jgi:hypothetical protein
MGGAARRGEDGMLPGNLGGRRHPVYEIEPTLDAVEALVEPRETSAQKVEEVASLTHV